MDIDMYEDAFNQQIKDGVHPNIYECIKAFLINDQPYIYDNRQFLDISTIDINLLPNRQLIVNEMNQRIKEVETEEKYKQKVQNIEESTSEEEEESSKSQFNKKGCLDYYFNKHRKKDKKPKRTESKRIGRKRSYAKTIANPFDNNYDDYDDYDDKYTRKGNYDDSLMFYGKRNKSMDNGNSLDNSIYNDIDNDIDNDNDMDMDMENDNDNDIDNDGDYSDDLMNDSFNV